MLIFIALFVSSSLPAIAQLPCYKSLQTRIAEAKPGSEFSADEIRQIGLNLQSLHSIRFKTAAFNDPDYWAALTEGFLRPFAAQENPLQALRRIWARSYSNPEELRQLLSVWTQAAGFGPTWTTKEILRSAWAQRTHYNYFQRFDQDDLVSSVGVLTPTVYLHLANKAFLGLDPHDFAGHLTALADRDFARIFKRFLKVADAGGGRISGAFNSSEMGKAHSVLEGFLVGFVRDATHENWTYLTPNLQTKKLTLFGSGASPVNLINFLKKGRLEEAALQLLGYRGTSSSVQIVQDLPRFNEFIRIKEHQGLYRRLELSLPDLAADSKQSLEWARVETLRVLTAAVEKSAGLTQFKTPEHVIAFMENLAAEILKSPRLAKMYHREARLEFFDASVSLVEHYLIWAGTNLEPYKNKLDLLPITRRADYQMLTKNFTLAEKKKFLQLFHDLKMKDQLFLDEIKKLVAAFSGQVSLLQILEFSPQVVKNLFRISGKARG